MKIRKPDYYDRFQCIAGACPDSCCIGWEIDVDEKQRKMYRNVTGELGERLRTCIDWKEGHFILQGKEERCPFLNEENLCDLIIGLGEDALCDICREHPRYYEWYDGLTEAGFGLCCMAAAELVLESESKVTFITEEQKNSLNENDASESECCKEEELEDSMDEDDSDTLEVLFTARETAFAILQNRDDSIWKRMRLFLAYIDEIQEALDFGNLDEIEESAEYYRELSTKERSEQLSSKALSSLKERTEAYKELIRMCQKLEPIDESWPKRLAVLANMLEGSELFAKYENDLSEYAKEREYEYEHLSVYFVYRYFMKCRSDGDIYSKGCLAVFCILLIYLLDVECYGRTSALSKEDRARNAKDCSKEIEYSEENLELLAELFWEEGFDKLAVSLYK